MDLNTKATGLKAESREKASILSKMEAITKEILRITEEMDLV